MYFRSAINEQLPTYLHDYVFIQCLVGQVTRACVAASPCLLCRTLQCDSEQLAKWLPLANKKIMIGS